MAMQFKDYYETLGVTKKASADEIKKAFRKLARQHHPDVVKAKDKESAEKKFKEINEAYEVLKDPEKRKKYDTLGADWQQGGGSQPPPGWQQQAAGGRSGGQPGGMDFEFDGTGFSDFFEAFFGGTGGRSQRGGMGNMGGFGGMGGMGGFPQQPQQAMKGRDIEADIMVTLLEALHGSKRKISFRRSSSAKTETYEVRVPAGVHEGQRIRLAGQGEAGSNGGGAGDLFLRVKLAQHPEFHLDGNDLIHELDLMPWDAVLGAEVTVPTLEGSAKLKIPAGTHGTQRFRLRRLGMPAGKGERGDLYVVVNMEVPKSLTANERELWEKLAAESQKK